jgi:cold shock CspA family protein
MTNTTKGVIESLRDTYGFIRGEDGVSRFFLPSALQQTIGITFEELQTGMRVEFIHIDHPRGPRAIEILVRR